MCQTAPKRRHHRGKDSESSSDPFDEEEEEEEDDDEDFDEIMQAKIAQMNKAKCLLQDLPARNPLQVCVVAFSGLRVITGMPLSPNLETAGPSLW